MGLIAAALGAASSTLKDQWLEYFYCESLPSDVLMVKGHKRTKGNNKGDDNIITNGSIVAVADGQCMIIVEQGRIMEICAEPGEYKYDIGSEPSIFSGQGLGGLGHGILESFKTFGRRFKMGGDTGKDQRVYYFNTKPTMGNLFGTQNPIPFRVVDNNIGLDIDVAVRCNGQYMYQITDPILFYVNVAGNVHEEFSKQTDSGTAGIRKDLRAGHPLQRTPRPHTGADRCTERCSERGLARNTRHHADEGHDQLCNDLQGRRADDQGGTARRDQPQSEYGGCYARERTGTGDAGCCKEPQRCDECFHGHEHGTGHGRRNESVSALCNGTAAAGCSRTRSTGSGSTGSGRLDLLLRYGQHRQILPELRLCTARTGGRLDLLLRHGQSGQVLPELRQQEAR